MAGTLRVSCMALAGLLLLGGCGTIEDMTRGDQKGKEEQINLFVEPDPGRPVGLRRLWRNKISSSPKTYLHQPKQFQVSGDSVYVGAHDGRVARVDRATGNSRWEEDLHEPIAGGVAVDGEHVYAGTLEGNVFALDKNTGQEVWKIRVSTSVASAPAAEGGRVALTTLDNRTYLLDGATGERIWVHSAVPESLVVMGAAPPVIHDGQLLVGYSTGEVYSLDINNGSITWTENLTMLAGRSELERLRDVDAKVVVSGRQAYSVNHQGQLVALVAPSGNRIWERNVSALRRPLLQGNRLYVSNMEGAVVALSADDGLQLWRTELTDGLLTGAVMVGDQVVVADDKKRLYSLDAASGRVVGKDILDGPVFADPVTEGNSLFLWMDSGHLAHYAQ